MVQILAALLSVLGLCSTLAGLFFQEQSIHRKLAFLFVAIFLLTGAGLERNSYYVALESVILLGCILGLLPRLRGKTGIIGLASVAALVYISPLKSFEDILSAAGLIAIAFGYALGTPIWYGLGSAAVCVHAWTSFARLPSVLLGALGTLNLVFATLSLWQTFKARSDLTTQQQISQP